jgi:hypothetical protein
MKKFNTILCFLLAIATTIQLSTSNLFSTNDNDDTYSGSSYQSCKDGNDINLEVSTTDKNNQLTKYSPSNIARIKQNYDDVCEQQTHQRYTPRLQLDLIDLSQLAEQKKNNKTKKQLIQANQRIATLEQQLQDASKLYPPIKASYQKTPKSLSFGRTTPAQSENSSIYINSLEQTVGRLSLQAMLNTNPKQRLAETQNKLIATENKLIVTEKDKKFYQIFAGTSTVVALGLLGGMIAYKNKKS